MLSKLFGIFTVGDVTADPTTDRTSTDAERIHAPAIIAKKVEEVDADLSSPGSLTTRPSCHPHRPILCYAATPQGNTVEIVPQEGEAAIESDPAARVLFLWVRRPADSSRWHSRAGPGASRQIRTLLSGYLSLKWLGRDRFDVAPLRLLLQLVGRVLPMSASR